VGALHVRIKTHKLGEPGVAEFAHKLLHLGVNLPVSDECMAAGESLTAHTADFVADV